MRDKACMKTAAAKQDTICAKTAAARPDMREDCYGDKNAAEKPADVTIDDKHA